MTSPHELDAYGSVGRSDWMDVDWQRHLRWVRVEERWMNIVDIGEGPVVLFVHGIAGSWQNWLENIPHFARDHRVVAVDLPGFGASELPDRDISIGGYADTLDALLDVLGVDVVRLVGNSMGGFIGAELAIRYPARVERLALVAAAGLSVEFVRTERPAGLRHEAENVLFATVGWIAARSRLFARRRRLRAALLSLFTAHPSRLPSAVAFEQVNASGTAGFPGALEALCRYPIRERLPAIECPTLIVWGAKDLLVPVKDATTFEQLIGNARKVVYEDTGHLTMLERPARFNADLRAFLDEQPAERLSTPDVRAFPA